MDSAAAAGGRERPAGFVPLLDTTPGTRPATPRAPFMPSPRKRAKGTPQKLRVPLRETALTNDGARARTPRSPALAKPALAMEEKEESEEEGVHTPAAPAPSRMTHARADAAQAASRRTAERTPFAASAKLGARTPFARADSPGKAASPGPTRSPSPRTLSDDRTTLLTRSTPRARGARRVLEHLLGRCALGAGHESGAAHRAPGRPRPATAISLTRTAIGTAPPRPGTSMATVARSPVRIASGERSEAPRVRRASPERTASAECSTPLPTALRPLRAKITDGVPRGPSARGAVRCAGRRPQPCADRAGAASPARPATAASIAPRALPQAAERVDVDAVAEELGESSFLLDDDEMEAGADGSDSVLVHVRVRPTYDDEACAWITTPDTATVMLDPAIAAQKVQPNVGVPYQFDGVHTGSSNADVYTMLARPLVKSVLRGYNAVVFAYGQTASGKTFTLSGGEDGTEPGIIPRAVCDVFQGICQGSAEREYLVRVSYLEIWNEIVRDLLDPSSQPQVRDDRRRGANAVFVAPLQEEVVTSPSQVFALLARGEANRHVGATDWNERSSRSHTCFKVTVESWERTSASDAEHVGRHYRISELSLIDLAGSERHTWGASRRTEGANINKSLLSLGKVIYALSERSAAERHERAPRTLAIHVPFRDSKLTRILQNSLNGNARIAVVCTLNPNPDMVEESLGTLNFARRIKKVAVRAEPNEFDGDLSLLVGTPSAETQALLVRYRAEMGALRAKVAELQQPTPTPSTPTEPARAPPTRATRATRSPPSPEAPSAASVEALQARLDELGALILRGGTAAAAEEPAAPHPVSPAKQRGFTFDDPLPLVQEKLHAALSKIARLERKLAARMSLPGVEASGDAAKDARIEALLRRVQELETVCAAQAAEAPVALREDVEAEFRAELDAAAQRIAERDAFLAEVTGECERLRRANAQLVRLAHQDTEKMVASLARRPERPVMSLFAPHLRPATVLGGVAASLPSTPARAWDAPISIDGTESDTLSTSDLDDVLESRDSL
ncbi:hypothetical protein CBS14141_000830 [Malassezia furfur]|nr:hypothetical protein CBS14141_000830 [Malassezia furfur]